MMPAKQRIERTALQAQPGDFGVVHMGGDAGKWIHIGQIASGILAGDDEFKDYEHAFVYVGGGQIVEAEPGGARLTQVHYSNILWSTDRIPLDLVQRRRIVEAAHGYVGTPYSAADYFAIAAKRLGLGVAVPSLRAYVASSKHMICSQLVDQCYQDAGVHLFEDGRWPGYVTPAALAGILKS
jgi:cell wall-associated NlpC family hydrolase